LRTVGGAWHEFEVEGINYGPTEDTYADDKYRRHRSEHDRENSIGLGGWRIELLPKGRPEVTNFLVVLHAADHATETMVPVEPIEGSKKIGARLKIGANDYEITFATAGPMGGHIRISEAATVLLDRSLAVNIEDNYKKWSNDPRYDTWMTHFEYRNFVGAGEP
jgi:hypothetical protein